MSINTSVNSNTLLMKAFFAINLAPVDCLKKGVKLQRKPRWSMVCYEWNPLRKGEGNLIKEIAKPRDAAMPNLLSIWERAVRVTHQFLSEGDIKKLRPLVEEALREIAILKCYEDARGAIVGFIGVQHEKIEMLFVDAESRGQGIGKKLVSDAMQNEASKYVDVNEQNPQAIGFYEHLGFVAFERSQFDEQGNPFPILHMKLADR